MFGNHTEMYEGHLICTLRVKELWANYISTHSSHECQDTHSVKY